MTTNFRRINTPFYGDIAFDILDSVHGQLSDGMWENSRRYDKYWTNLQVCRDGDNHIYFNVNADYYGMYCGRGIDNPFARMSDTEFLNWYANKLKAVIVQEGKDNSWSKGWWSRTNHSNKTIYLNRSADVTVADVYCVYDALKGRIFRSSAAEKSRVISEPLTREAIEAAKQKAREELNEAKEQLKAKYEADLFKVVAEFSKKIYDLDCKLNAVQ